MKLQEDITTKSKIFAIGENEQKDADDDLVISTDDVLVASPDEDDTNENYGHAKIRAEMEKCAKDSSKKPGLSYIALIGLAIQHGENHQMILGDIYDWISKSFPYYSPNDRSWRNSVRHNLSLNECFVKSERNKGGKGSHWTIHPANVKDFLEGDFRRRRARIHVRQWELHAKTRVADEYSAQSASDVYVPMSCVSASAELLISMYGREAILGNEEKLALLKAGKGDYQPDSPESLQSSIQSSNPSPSSTSPAGAMNHCSEYLRAAISNNQILNGTQSQEFECNRSYDPYTACSQIPALDSSGFSSADAEFFTDDMALESGLKILSDALELDNAEPSEFLDISESFQNSIQSTVDNMIAMQSEVVSAN